MGMRYNIDLRLKHSEEYINVYFKSSKYNRLYKRSIIFTPTLLYSISKMNSYSANFKSRRDIALIYALNNKNKEIIKESIDYSYGYGILLALEPDVSKWWEILENE